MKLQLLEKKDLTETEIDIRYSSMTQPLNRIVQYIRQQEYLIQGIFEKKLYQIPLNEVLYFETVDKKTFTSLLPKFIDDMEIRLNDFDHSALLCTTIETSDVTGGGSELFLVQSLSVHISMVVLMRQQSKLRLSNMPNRSKLTSAR